MNLRSVVLFLSVVPAAVGSQDRPVLQQTSPVMDMIDQAKNSLNNLQYSQARTTAREVLALTKLKRQHEIAALQLAAAAYLPDEMGARMPDSATIFLRRLARIMPAGGLPTDIRSATLDSALANARSTTFGANAQVPIELTIRGTESRPSIDVVSTRPARWQLYLIARDGPAPLLLDTLASTTTGRLSLRAHNGSSPILQPGDHRLRVVAQSTSADSETIEFNFDASFRGTIPTLVIPPSPPDPARMLPEKATKALGAGIAGGIIVGGATWALANAMRPSGALGETPKDSRGTVVGVAISLGAVAAGLLDRGRPLPDNVRKNSAARATYLTQMGEAAETNRKRIAEYALAITIDPEAK